MFKQPETMSEKMLALVVLLFWSFCSGLSIKELIFQKKKKFLAVILIVAVTDLDFFSSLFLCLAKLFLDFMPYSIVLIRFAIKTCCWCELLSKLIWKKGKRLRLSLCVLLCLKGGCSLLPVLKKKFSWIHFI